MKYNLLIFSFASVFLLTAMIFEVNYLGYRSPVNYSNWKTISFYDFKGYKKPGETLFGSNNFAFIRLSRHASLINDTTAEVNTYFHPSRSYVFEQQIRDPELLKHELYHFHIAEYCTRLFRKEILACQPPLTASKLEELAEKYEAIEDDLQRAYDDESYHSYVLKEQKRWERYIDSALVQLNDCSSPVVYIRNSP